jgi:hypothetical protein
MTQALLSPLSLSEAGTRRQRVSLEGAASEPPPGKALSYGTLHPVPMTISNHGDGLALSEELI